MECWIRTDASSRDCDDVLHAMNITRSGVILGWCLCLSGTVVLTEVNIF
jgi:hypothetical protein